MRRFLLVLALGALATLAACGDGGNAFSFESKALAEPQGDPIRIAYRMTPGQGVRMQMAMKGTLAMSGAMDMRMPMDVSMTMTWTCADVLPNGDTVIDMALETMRATAGEHVVDTPDALGGFSGRMVVGSDGRVKERRIEGLGSAADGQLKQLLDSPGFQAFVPMPPEGMRVGEAIDLAAVMPREALQALMSSAGPQGMDLDPRIQGEVVLAGVREIDGERAAEFAVNMVMNVAGTVRKDGGETEMDMGLRVQGTQFASLETGLPVGSASVTMEMRADVESGDTDMHMEMDATITIQASRL